MRLQDGKDQLNNLLRARRIDSETLLAAASCYKALKHPGGVLPIIANALKHSPKDLQLHMVGASLCYQVRTTHTHTHTHTACSGSRLPLGLCEDIHRFAQHFSSRTSAIEGMLTANRMRRQRLVDIGVVTADQAEICPA